MGVKAVAKRDAALHVGMEKGARVKLSCCPRLSLPEIVLPVLQVVSRGLSPQPQQTTPPPAGEGSQHRVRKQKLRAFVREVKGKQEEDTSPESETKTPLLVQGEQRKSPPGSVVKPHVMAKISRIACLEDCKQQFNAERERIKRAIARRTLALRPSQRRMHSIISKFNKTQPVRRKTPEQHQQETLATVCEVGTGMAPGEEEGGLCPWATDEGKRV